MDAPVAPEHEGGTDGFVVVQLVELLLAFVATALVLPALSRNFRRFKRRGVARHALFLSVVFSDWLFAAIGVVHHIALLGQGGHEKLARSLAGVTLVAMFHMSFAATLLWPPILAFFALRQGNPKFFVRLNWQFAWLIAGVYGMLWARALQRDRMPEHWIALEFGLTGILIGSTTVVFGVAAYMYMWKSGMLSKKNQERRVVEESKLLVYLVVITILLLPHAVVIWVGSSVPPVVQNASFSMVLLTPTLNAYNYGSPATIDLMMQDKRSRSRTGGATHTSVTDDLIQSMDPDNVALEELDGLSDMVFLAEGAAGAVYKARWLGIDVAMKLIKLPNAGENHELYQTIIQNSEAAFLAEASICARLRHPNITLFIRAGHFEGKLGILTEYCQRGSLKDVLKKHVPLAWKRKISLALDVAKGLTYLHARNPTYIHRDLKASNILVTDTWQGKLADFGISKVSNFVRNNEGLSTRGGFVMSESGVDGGGEYDTNAMTMRTLNEATSFAGTWRWNAPEILRDPTNCRYSRSTDMYSFGMVLWEILSDGAVPFSDVRFDFEVRERVLCEQRPQIKQSPGCPDAFVNLILECWAQKPSARPTAPLAASQLTQILESMDSKSVGSIDTGSEQSSIFFTDRSARSTFATRITNFFRGGASHRATTSSQISGLGSSRGLGSSQGLGSSRGFASSRGFFFRSGGPRNNEDEDNTNKFAMLGSPSSTASRSTTSSTSSGFSFHVGSTRRRGFSREAALPSLHEYDAETSVSDADAAATMDAGMSPIVELPMDAMLEDGGHPTFFDDKPPSDSDLQDHLFDRDSEQPPRGPTERSRGLTFESNKSGDSIVDATAHTTELDELARTQPIKFPQRAKFPVKSDKPGASLFI